MVVINPDIVENSFLSSFMLAGRQSAGVFKTLEPAHVHYDLVHACKILLSYFVFHAHQVRGIQGSNVCNQLLKRFTHKMEIMSLIYFSQQQLLISTLPNCGR